MDRQLIAIFSGETSEAFGTEEIVCGFDNIIQLLVVEVLMNTDMRAVVGAVFGFWKIPEPMP
jgi:hypothetical protein